MLEQVRFAFIGGGNMGEALIKGLLSGLGVKPQHIIATDVVPERRAYMQATYGYSPPPIINTPCRRVRW